MNESHHCNDCPEWYVTKKRYPSLVANVTYCKKYDQQLYYLYGEENDSPHPCSKCEKNFSYVPYIIFPIKEVRNKMIRIHQLSSKIYENQKKMILDMAKKGKAMEEEKNEKITVNECRSLREITGILTRGCVITKGEFEEIMAIYYRIIERMEREELYVSE